MNDLVVRDKNELVEQLQQKLQSKENRMDLFLGLLCGNAIDTCFAHREREMRLKIQQDLKERGIEVDLIGNNGLIKKRKYYA